jgi:hypothetical protein
VPLPNWRNAAEYHFPPDFPAHRWAWEFLRRNPDYRKDWASVLARYLANPGDYFDPGQSAAQYAQQVSADDSWNPLPEHPNFYLPADESAKWSLYDMVNPATDDPGFLAFNIQFGFLFFKREGAPVYPGGAQYPWAFFNLNLPLKPQLETARRMLTAEQKRQGINPGQVKHHRKLWPRYVRLLDAEIDGRTPTQTADGLVEEFFGLDVKKVWNQLQYAKRMTRPDGYLTIFLSSGNSDAE